MSELTPEEREILDRLGGLPAAAELPRDLWPGIAARIAGGRIAVVPPQRRRPRLGRILLQAAAALLLFAAGFVAGQVTSDRPGIGAAPGIRRDPLSAAIAVQRTGTEYVAALASLRTAGDRASREQGREVAFSAFYGAAHELTRLAPEDPRAQRILTTVSTSRRITRF